MNIGIYTAQMGWGNRLCGDQELNVKGAKPCASTWAPHDSCGRLASARMG